MYKSALRSTSSSSSDSRSDEASSPVASDVTKLACAPKAASLILATRFGSDILLFMSESAIAQQLTDASDNAVTHEDNAAAIHLVKNGISTRDRTEHILLRHFFLTTLG